MVGRLARWDVPFGADMSDAQVDALMQRPEIAAIQADRFPPSVPLRGILRNDARIVTVSPGEIVVREGDYGNSAFLILDGSLRVVLPPGLPRESLGRQTPRSAGLLATLARAFRPSPQLPEMRDVRPPAGAVAAPSKGDARALTFLQDIPAILDRHRSVQLGAGEIFGEIAALGRVPRSATVFAESPSRLLEIRWQGLRELRRHDPGWRRMIDERYRRNALLNHLQAQTFFSSLDEATLASVAAAVRFRTYGDADWHVAHKRGREAAQADPSADVAVPIDQEAVIAAEGGPADSVYLIRSGFARVSCIVGGGRRTITYLGVGAQFGLAEAHAAWKTGREIRLSQTLSAIGQVDVLRVPVSVLVAHVFPGLHEVPAPYATQRRIEDDAFVDWLIDERWINGTQTMLIDLDRCVRCDDCVRACAATHDGNPRFVRHGPVSDRWMVANACMHCQDPVCMIGCPTGAIHRHELGGVVIINDDTCIGCGTCAASCPYDNIRMVEIADRSGRPLVDENGAAVRKATKCDLCVGQPGGPACVRACPQDALRRTGGQALLIHGVDGTPR